MDIYRTPTFFLRHLSIFTYTVRSSKFFPNSINFSKFWLNFIFVPPRTIFTCFPAVNECQEEELAEIKKKIQELAKSTLISCEAVRSHVVSASAGTSVTGVKRDLCKEAKSPEDDLHMRYW